MTSEKQVVILKDLLNIAADRCDIVWEPFHEGVEIYRLYGDGNSGAAAALLRYQAGATIPKHNHLGFEHIFVLSGTQTDGNGTHEAGTLLIHPPDTEHSVVSKSGCVILAIWEKPVLLTN